MVWACRKDGEGYADKEGTYVHLEMDGKRGRDHLGNGWIEGVKEALNFRGLSIHQACVRVLEKSE